MNQRGLWNAALTAMAAICMAALLAPLLVLLLGSSPAELWRALGDGEVAASLALTFGCGFLATLFGLAFGTPLAYLLARRDFVGKSLVQGVVDLPVVIPHPVAGIALLLLFSGLGRAFSPVSHWSGIVVAMFFVSVSLLINSAREGFRSIPPQMEWTSRSLGKGPFATFFLVSVPLARTDLLAGSIMMWARSISEFGSIVILAYNPKVASVLIYDRFTSYGLSQSLPVAALLLIVSVLLFGLMRAMQERKPRLAGR